jgi:hypothetical protein
MHNLKTDEIIRNHQKSQLRAADNYRLSQQINEHNKHKFDWRDLLKPFNRSNR